MQHPITVRRVKAGAPITTRQEPAPFSAYRQPEPTDCGFGRCAREPACTTRCAYKLAHIAANHTQTPAEREQAQREAAEDIRVFVADANGAKIAGCILFGVFLVVIVGAALAAWGV